MEMRYEGMGLMGGVLRCEEWEGVLRISVEVGDKVYSEEIGMREVRERDKEWICNEFMRRVYEEMIRGMEIRGRYGGEKVLYVEDFMR